LGGGVSQSQLVLTLPEPGLLYRGLVDSLTKPPQQRLGDIKLKGLGAVKRVDSD